MREILFRGKRVDNGEWNYGVPIVNTDCVPPKYMMLVCVIGGGLGIEYKEVIPETVGQFTGLLDKNGKKIFEGDIFNLGDKDILYIVVWSDTGFRGRQTRTTSYVGLEYWKDRIKIIGNIHDNPELVEAR